MTKVINFENKIQKALFDHELMGQISDGNWENSKPYNHYESFTNIKTDVNPDAPGKIRVRPLRKYNFNDSTLFSIVGDRMVNIANLAENGYSDKTIQDFDDAEAYSHDLLSEGETNEYWVKKRVAFIETFGDIEGYRKATSGKWNAKNVRKELERISEIVNE
jgi:hypothetical protein